MPYGFPFALFRSTSLVEPPTKKLKASHTPPLTDTLILQQEIQLLRDQLHSTKLLLHRLSADQEYIQYKQKVLRDDTTRIDERSLAATSDLKKTNLNASTITLHISDLSTRLDSLYQQIAGPTLSQTITDVVDSNEQTFDAVLHKLHQYQLDIDALSAENTLLRQQQLAASLKMNQLESMVNEIKRTQTTPFYDHPGRYLAEHSIKQEPDSGSD
jgi:chromosome segregation ATPase